MHSVRGPLLSSLFLASSNLKVTKSFKRLMFIRIEISAKQVQLHYATAKAKIMLEKGLRSFDPTKRIQVSVMRTNSLDISSIPSYFLYLRT